MAAHRSTRAHLAVVDAAEVGRLLAALTDALEGAGPPVFPRPVPAGTPRLTPYEPADAPIDGTAAVVLTSGSTGEPKVAMLTAAAMRASATATLERLGGPGRWLLSLPTSSVAGLQVLTRSILAGTRPEVVAPTMPPAEVAPAVERLTADPDTTRGYAALVPTQLRRLLDDPLTRDALASLDGVLVGGGPTADGLAARARSAGLTVYLTYGMTETCGGCVYDGRPLTGVAVSVRADARIRLGGSTVFAGYLGRPDLTATVLDDGWFTTSDLGVLADDGTLRVTGRSDDVVVSGGVNVPLPLVTARLQEHPDVADAACVGTPDSDWGTAVVAFVVLQVPPRARSEAADGVAPVGVAPDEDGLRRWVADTLGRTYAPRRVLGLASIPLLPNGKPDRDWLVRLAGRDS